MSLEALRDLIIVIFCITLAVVLTAAIVSLLLFYNRFSAILDSIYNTSEFIYKVSTRTSRVLRPLSWTISFIRGIQEGIHSTRRVFRKKARHKAP